MVREQAREPQAVVSQVHLQQESPFTPLAGLGQARNDIHQVVVGGVVGLPDARVPVVAAELEQPAEIHQRTPFIVGSKREVEALQKAFAGAR